MYHRFDTNLFQVFSPNLGVITTYGRFRLKHELHKDPSNSGTWYAQMDRSYDCSFVSVDGGDFVKYDYDWVRNNPTLRDELDLEIQKDFNARRAARNKQLAQQRIQNDKAEAKKRGISLEELRADRRDARKVFAEENKIEKRVEYTNRLMKAAPMIRILHDDLADILKKIELGEELRLGHVEAGLRRLEKAQTVVARWRKTYQNNSKNKR